MIKATYALVGEVAYKVPDEAVADKIMKVGIYPVGTGVQISREVLNTDGTLNYTKLITYLTENVARNQLIADSIEQRPSLILSDRLNHLETLISLLPADMQKDAVMISGKMTTKKGKAEREQALEDMRRRQEEIPLCYILTGEGRAGRTTVGASVPNHPTEGLRCGDTEYRAYRSYLRGQVRPYRLRFRGRYSLPREVL